MSMQDIDARASKPVIYNQGNLSETIIRLPEFYELLESPNKILVSLIHVEEQLLPGPFIAKVKQTLVYVINYSSQIFFIEK